MPPKGRRRRKGESSYIPIGEGSLARYFHKLARLFYRLLNFGTAYVEQGQSYYEQKYKERLVRNLNRRAKEFGFQLTPLDLVTGSVS